MSNQSSVTLAGIRDWFKKKLREDNSITRLLVKIETKTKVDREYIALGKFIYLLRIISLVRKKNMLLSP